MSVKKPRRIVADKVPGHRRIDLEVQPCIYVNTLGEAIGLPDADADWDKATVVVRVPVHATATTSTAEIEVPLSVFAGLLAQHSGATVKAMDGETIMQLPERLPHER
jgi:hypothetical protein